MVSKYSPSRDDINCHAIRPILTLFYHGPRCFAILFSLCGCSDNIQ